VLVDANILLYSVDEDSPFHAAARDWMAAALNGSRRVGIPWVSLWAFVRIATNPRASAQPMTPGEAWQHVEEWLDAPATWIPEPGRGHRAILGPLLIQLDLRAGLASDAVLAALCLEHGLTMVSADSDFARFGQIAWVNPVAPG
jgi:toxin-antitoxin system PIN domain toxin